MTDERALKHQFGPALLKRVAASLHEVYPSFDQEKFRALMPALKPLEMKPRVHLLRDALKKLLPGDYARALKILVRSAQGGKLEGFDLWPYTEFVQTYGLAHPRLSLDALKEFTRVF